MPFFSCAAARLEFAIPFVSICCDPRVQVWLEKMRKHEPNLYRHSLRVGKLATEFHRYVGMDFERGWNLIEGALLHDVGKICLPASVLMKPKELNAEEKRMLALHPSIGAELLEAQGYFTKTVINIVRRHHERLDGTGYPDGWRGRRIAKMVRVVAVCDAVCAMTGDRPYEDAWPWQEAFLRLQAMPAQYDAETVATLKRMIEERGTEIDLRARQLAVPRRSQTASGVQHPRSAFFAARFRKGIRLIQ